MKRRTLKKILRKQYSPRVVFPFLIFIAALIIIIINPFKGKLKTVSVTQLSDINSLYGSDNYVQIAVNELNYSGIDYKDNGKTKARVYYSISDNHCYYFIISTKNLPKDYLVLKNQTITARLVRNNSMYRDINASMSNSLNFSISGLNAISSDILISQYDFVHGFTTFYFTVSVIVCILSLFFGICIILIIISPTISICALRLGKYGNRKTLFALAEAEFDISVATGHKNVYITDNFLIVIHATSIDIVPLNKIAWVYHYSEMHHTRKKTKVNTPLCIVTDRRKMIKIHHVSQITSDRIINVLTSSHPEILVGYNET